MKVNLPVRMHYHSIIRLPDHSLTTFVALADAGKLVLVRYDRVEDATDEVVETRYFADLLGSVFWFWELQPSTFLKLKRKFRLSVRMEISRLR